MIFAELSIKGAFVIDLEPHRDERGFFARSFCTSEFETFGLDAKIVQENISNNALRGTLRGIHYQAAGGTEAKTVRCMRGSIYDIVVDLRRESPTFGNWASVELDAEKKRAVYIPPGCGHAFQTLTNDCDVHYAMSAAWESDLARGLRYDDAAFAIPWPVAEPVLSTADRAWPSFAEAFA